MWSLGFLNNGRRLACGSRDACIRVWEVEAGRGLVGPIREHTWDVLSVAFSEDSMRFASWSTGDTWICGGRNKERAGESGTWGACSCICPRERSSRYCKQHHSCCGPNESNWTLEGHVSDIWSIAASRTGRRVASASLDGTARIWDLETRRIVEEILEHSCEVSSVVFTPDGQQVVTRALRTESFGHGRSLRTSKGRMKGGKKITKWKLWATAYGRR